MHEISPNEEWQRLYGLYHAMSDDELLELGTEIGDLTDLAWGVLKKELETRKLPLPDAGDEPTSQESENNDVDGGSLVSLTTLLDAIDCRHACELLEEGGIAFEVRDESMPQSGFSRTYNGPPLILKLLVLESDIERAKSILREGMGLFPLQEVTVGDETVDDGTLAGLGDFGTREETEEVAAVLRKAGIWHRVETNTDGTLENENCYSIKVREIDLLKAGDVVEKALNLPEI